MKRRFTAAVVGVGTLAISSGIALLGGVAANAATPGWEPDPNGVGSISFFNSSGAQVTSGNITDTPFSLYAVGTVLPRAGDTKAKLEFAQPDPTKVNTLNWTAAGITALASSFPVPAAAGTPTSISSLPATTPVVTESASDSDLENDIAQLPNTGPTAMEDGVSGCAYSATLAGCNTTGFENIYQLRLLTTNGTSDSTAFDTADILVDPATDNWTQVFPASKQATTTTLVANPSPGVVGQTETLTATEAPAVAGSVQFVDGSTPIGSPVAVSAGVATTTSTFTLGSHSLSAVFTPTDTTDNSGSTGTATLVVNPAATPTKTALGINSDGFAGDDVTLTATVTGPSGGVNAGTVAFFDNGSSSPLTGTASGPTAGVYTLDITAGLAAGGHSIVAKFTPTDNTAFQASQSAAGALFLNTKAAGGSPCAQAGSVCSESQSIQTAVPTGTLVINTPYTASAPLILPDMTLNAAGTLLTTSAPFLCIQVTDSTSGATPFTAQALAQPLTDSSPPSPVPAGAVTSINPENVGLTGLTKPVAPADGAACPDVQTYTGGTGVSDNPAASGVSPTDTGTFGLGGTAAHTFATGGGGDGTATFDGTLTINAPTSTASGLYKGTIVFTVSD
jgi:Bacterial Ig-like domain (group 3)